MNTPRRSFVKRSLLFFVVLVVCTVASPLVASAACSDTAVQVYRSWNAQTSDHFYTTSLQEKDNAIPFGWKYEGVGFYAFNTQVAGSKPMYRAWNPQNNDHFYSTSMDEINNAKPFGWNYEGVAFYVFESQVPGSTAVYRSWNPTAGSGRDHFYTTDHQEALNAVPFGWQLEGIGFYAFNSAFSIDNGTCNITCSTNSDCPSGSLTGSPTCQGNNIYQNFRTYRCDNAGTQNSTCTPINTPQLQHNCDANQTCTGGSCVTNVQTLTASCQGAPNPATTGAMVTFSPTNVSGGTGNYTYHWSQACNGFNQNCSTTFDAPGTQTAYLTVTSGSQHVDTSCFVTVNPPAQIACYNNSDCPPGYFHGGTTCRNGNVWQNFTKFTCINGGSANAVCQPVDAPQEQTICHQNQTCAGGVCVTNAPPVVASCTVSPSAAQTGELVTFSGSATGGNNNYTYLWSNGCSAFNQTCATGFNTPGTHTALLTVTSGNQSDQTTCSVNITAPQNCTPNASKTCVGNLSYNVDSCGHQGSLAENCSTSNKICSAATGTCVPTTCSTNSQCGTDGYTGNPTCQGNNIYQNWRTWTCVNPNSVNAQCQHSDAQQQVTTCGQNQTCSGGTCNTNVATLTATCSASPNPANTGSTVTFAPTINGGSGGYTYSWTQACTGTNQNCSKQFDSAGNYTAMLHVHSGDGQDKYAFCSVAINNVNTLSVTTNSANNISTTGATLNGTLNDMGQYSLVGVKFEWGTSTNYGHQTSVTNKTSTGNFSIDTGTVLVANTTYHFRAIAKAGQETAYGQDTSFTTSANPNDLTASCTASPSTVTTGQNVSFSATNVSGGNNSYTYHWEGACNGNSQSCVFTPISTGTKTANLTVTSDGQTTTTSCSVTVNAAATGQCSQKSDCGTDTYEGNGFCVGNSVYKNYRTFSCTNPNTANSTCSSSVTQKSVNDCLSNQTCTGGTCSTTQTIACYSDSGCAGSGFTGSQYCSGNNIWQNYTTYTCQNPGTSSSQCVLSSTVGQQRSICGSNQTCQSGNCININNTNNNTCIYHSYQQCSNNGVFWYDSCGNRQDLVQNCLSNQTCSGSTCINQNQNTNSSLTISETVRNLSTGNLNLSNSVNASPSDIVQFNIVVSSYGSQTVNNVTVRNTLPANLIYNNNVTLDGVTNSGNLVSGLYIGSVTPGQQRIITYQVRVADAANFAFGTTTLTDNSTATSTDAGSTAASSNASVVVTKSGVLGATTVSTGLLTGNFWADSFLAPLVLALLGVGVWKAGLLNNLAFAGWIQNRKNSFAQKKLEERIGKIREKENS